MQKEFLVTHIIYKIFCKKIYICGGKISKQKKLSSTNGAEWNLSNTFWGEIAPDNSYVYV